MKPTGTGLLLCHVANVIPEQSHNFLTGHLGSHNVAYLDAAVSCYLKSLTRSFANMAAGPSELHQTLDVMYVDMHECKIMAAIWFPDKNK